MAVFKGYIADNKSSRLRGKFGIMRDGIILAGPTDTDDNGYFEVNASPGEQLFFSADGYITKVYDTVGFGSDTVVFLQKNINPVLVAAVVAAAYYILSKKGGKVSGIDSSDIKTIAFVVGGVLAFDIIKQILEGIGLWKSAESKTLDHAGSDPNSFWNPNFWQRSQVYSYTISPDQAAAYAKEIYDSFGAFNDCEECVIGIFRSFRTKANISFLAYTFQGLYKQDLLSFLRGGLWPQDRLSDADVFSINNFAAKLPDF